VNCLLFLLYLLHIHLFSLIDHISSSDPAPTAVSFLSHLHTRIAVRMVQSYVLDQVLLFYPMHAS
jgi:hypothetical protein